MSNGTPDPDDFFADTRMSFGDHIEDLRVHLWRAVKGFVVALFLSFFIGKYVVNFITAPVKNELRKFNEKRTKEIMRQRNEDADLRKTNQPTAFFPLQLPRKQWDALRTGQPGDMRQPRIVTRQETALRKGTASWWDRWIAKWWGDNPDVQIPPEEEKDKYYQIPEEDQDKELITIWVRYQDPLATSGYLQPSTRTLMDIDSPTTLNVQEAFMVWFKVCVVCGIVIGSPWIFWQVWAFVAAGLYPHEKRLVHVYLPVSLFLFLAGVTLCELFVIPKAIEALLWFNEWLGFKPDLRLNEWLGFAIYMPLIFGLSFQTPLVMLFLGRLGIMDADSFRKKRRYAWFFMAVFAAIITPSTDALSMLFLWVPMSLLFELGIWLIQWQGQPAGLDSDVPEPDEMVEV